MTPALRASLAAALALASGFEAPRSSAAGAGACSLDPAAVPLRPTRLEGTVVGTVPPERARAATAGVERDTGARVSPDYADLPRVVVRVVAGRKTFETVAAVVDGRIPGPGEPVGVLSRYRDPRSRCSFIPWTVSTPPALS